MAKRILSYLIFTILMTCIISGSLILIVTLYLPFVALKAVVFTLSGKAKHRLAERQRSPTST